MRCKNEVLTTQLLQIPYDPYRERAVGVFLLCAALSSWHLFILEEVLVFQSQIKSFL